MSQPSFSRMPSCFVWFGTCLTLHFDPKMDAPADIFLCAGSRGFIPLAGVGGLSRQAHTLDLFQMRLAESGFGATLSHKRLQWSVLRTQDGTPGVPCLFFRRPARRGSGTRTPLRPLRKFPRSPRTSRSRRSPGSGSCTRRAGTIGGRGRACPGARRPAPP